MKAKGLKNYVNGLESFGKAILMLSPVLKKCNVQTEELDHIKNAMLDITFNPL